MEKGLKRPWMLQNPMRRLVKATGIKQSTLRGYINGNDPVQDVVKSIHKDYVQKTVTKTQKVDDFDKGVVRRTIYDLHKKSQSVTMPKLQEALKKKDIDISISTVSRTFKLKMDGLSVEEFLIQIGQEFQSFSSVFRQNGFGSLRCIRVNEDIKIMFKEANICLLLGIKRQLQNTLMNLKDVSETCGLSASTKQKSAEKPSMGKILDTNKAAIYTLKRQLDNSEAELNTMTLVEKAKDQARRCTNCHETGHKADGNKNNQPCAKLPCMSISNCGQVDKHPEYTIEKRRKQREVGQLKQKMKKMTEEQKIWGMVIHGGIDGFSRMVTFINLALDNKAATALEPFVRGCQEFGVPSRVRTDHATICRFREVYQQIQQFSEAEDAHNYKDIRKQYYSGLLEIKKEEQFLRIRKVFQNEVQDLAFSSAVIDYSVDLLIVEQAKTKKSLKAEPIYKIITKSCIAVHSNGKESDIDEALSDFLRHAPHQAGGLKYKVPVEDCNFVWLPDYPASPSMELAHYINTDTKLEPLRQFVLKAEEVCANNIGPTLLAISCMYLQCHFKKLMDLVGHYNIPLLYSPHTQVGKTLAASCASNLIGAQNLYSRNSHGGDDKN
ncbi:unnamed protein product [Mytilus edulis]|uniref:Integrase core domain-containing protein n=1 Tax=Mytilus edulis TaxID=6550 RepID=A0A8S3PT09_MYTED|nr:unnamed protein product [Mytilus edulis]